MPQLSSIVNGNAVLRVSYRAVRGIAAFSGRLHNDSLNRAVAGCDPGASASRCRVLLLSHHSLTGEPLRPNMAMQQPLINEENVWAN